MAKAHMLMTLGKVIIAAAWADGEVAHDEINSLKDLLFRLPELTGLQWAELDMYIESPVGEDERARLLAELQDAISSQADKKLALYALHEMIYADGVVTDDEKRVAGEIEAAIEAADVGVFNKMSGFLRGPLKRRSEALADTPNREEYFEDFVKNKVFYSVRRRLEGEGSGLDIPEGDLRKLSLAGGIMARVAHVDKVVTDEEFAAMVKALEKGWGVDHAAATFVTEVAVSDLGSNLDYYRMSREFFENTSEDERLAFVNVLFDVAAADDFATHDEIEEIRSISQGFKLTHKQFIDAKVKILREKRAT